MVAREGVVVIGAGAAGLMAAIAAARRGAGVTIIEHLAQPGVKLLATGGGRCNLSNLTDAQAFMQRFGRQGRFLAHALAAMNCQGLRDFLAALGVKTYTPDGVGIYPASNSAATVQQALWRCCQDLGVKVLLGASAAEVLLDASSSGGPRVRGVRVAKSAAATRPSGAPAGDMVPGGKVIIATGGKGYASLGGSGAGYELAKKAGHTIIEPTEALVPLISREDWPARCAGASLNGARVWIDHAGQPKAGVIGDVLFTHNGVSGPAVLDISGDVAELLSKLPSRPAGKAAARDQAGVTLRICPKPDMTEARWARQLEDWQREQGARLISTALRVYMPGSLAEIVCRVAGVGPFQTCAHLGRQQRADLSQLLGGLGLTIVATEGFDRAMVTRGGVRLKDVDPRTMASRLVDGLYFAGEVLDLDGPCGGFNLQMAFSTGFLAGTSAV